MTWRVVAALVLLLAAFLAGIRVESWRADARIEKLRADQAWQAGRAAQDALDDTRRLSDAQTARTKRLQAGLEARDDAVRALSERLRDLKPDDLLPPGDSAAECSAVRDRGAELYRSLAERGMALAADAEAVRQSLIECRAAYEAIGK